MNLLPWLRGFTHEPRNTALDFLFFRRHASRSSRWILRWFGRWFGYAPIKERNRFHIRRHLRNRDLELVSYPKLLHVEMSTYCNLRCRMCSIVRPARTRKLQHLEMDVMERLRPALPFVSDTKMHGGGEPFLNPNIEKIIEIFQAYEVRLNTVTNASLIDDRLARLIGRNFTTLTVSVDGTDAEVYEYVRERAHFHRLLKGLDLLGRHRRDDFKLILGMVLMRCNAHQLPDLVRMARAYGAQEVQAAWVVPFADLPWTHEQDPTREPERMNAMLKEAYALGESLGVGVKLPPPIPTEGRAGRAVHSHKPTYHNLHPTDRVEGQCRLMYDRAMVLVDGTIKPCGQSRSVPGLGTLKTQPFDEIWSGVGYRQLRSEFNGGWLPRTCQSCNFIRSGQLGSARLVVLDESGERTPIMPLDRPR